MLEYLCKILLIWYVVGGIVLSIWLFKERKRRGHFPIVRWIDFMIYVPFWPVVALVLIFGPCDGPSTDEK